jgi:tetratricopeptide (TPR) repeat protein
MEKEAIVEASVPVEAPKDEVKIGGQVVSKEIADTVEEANAALTAKNFKAAVTGYEKAAAALPDYTPIRFALARAYYGAGDLEKAIASMEQVVRAEPADTNKTLLLANMLLETKQIDRATAMIAALPPDAVSADTLLNAGIALMNKKQPAAAVAYFTRAIKADPQSHLGYYYRGLAFLQQKKNSDARPDLQKVIELAPSSDEAKEAKDYLTAIK